MWRLEKFHCGIWRKSPSTYRKITYYAKRKLAELFDTSKQTVSYHIASILNERELDANPVVKNYLTTAADGKQYNVTFYSLDMILAIGFRVRSKRGVQFRQWANQHLKEYLVN